MTATSGKLMSTDAPVTDMTVVIDEATNMPATTPGVQRVAPDVQQRVLHLQRLAARVTEGFLALADTLYREHDAALWQTAVTTDGGRYASEEVFWEEGVGVKRRTAYQLIAVGRAISKLTLSADDRDALAAVGLHKLDVLVPVLERRPEAATEWIAVARSHSREALRERVGEALGRPVRPAGVPGARFQTFLINAMPDLESRQLAEDFFAAGAAHTGSDNAVGIVVAAMQEALGTWSAGRVDAVAGGASSDPEAKSTDGSA